VIRPSLSATPLGKFPAAAPVVGISVAVVVVLVGAAAPLRAGEVTWTGAANQDWANPANWSAPPVRNSAVINLVDGNFPVIATSPPFVPVDIIVGKGGGTGRLDQTDGLLLTGERAWMLVGSGANSNGTFNLTGDGGVDVGGTTLAGRFTLADGNKAKGLLVMNTSGTINAKFNDTGGPVGVLVGTNGGQGRILLQDGTINTISSWFGDNNPASVGILDLSGGSFLVGGNLLIGRKGGTGIINVTGGLLDVTREIMIAEGTKADVTATGTLSISGEAMVNVSQWLPVGRSGAPGTLGTLNVSGGTLHVNTSLDKGNLEIAVFSGAGGIANISGGEVNLHANASIILGSQDTIGDGTFNQTGGTITFYQDGGTTVGGKGVLDIGARTSSGNYTYNLNGGILVAPSVTHTSPTGKAAFCFNGGTLRAALPGDKWFPNNGALRTEIRNGGAILDTNGLDASFTEDIAHSDREGDNPIDGGLTKEGAGTLVLTGTNSYTGATLVHGGTLVLSKPYLADTSVVVIGAGCVLGLPHGQVDQIGSLTINGQMKPPGLYDSTNARGSITGPGKLHVVPPGR